MTKALTPKENSKIQSDNTKTPPKTSISTVNWSDDSHPTYVVKPVYGIPTFQDQEEINPIYHKQDDFLNWKVTLP